MSLNLAEASKPKSKMKKSIPNGVHMARIVQVIDLGEQTKTDWKTQEVVTYDDGNPVIQPKVLLTFELPNQTITIDEEEKPCWLFKEYVVSTHEKAGLTQLLSSVMPDCKILSELLNQPVMLTVGKTSGGNDKITAVTGVPEGVPVGELKNPMTTFDMANFDQEAYEQLPTFLQNKIAEAKNFTGKKVVPVEDTFDTDEMEEEDPFND